MSKKNQPPRMTAKKEEFEIKKTPEKKPKKGIIIAVAAVVLVVATVLTAVFVVKPSIDKGETTTGENDKYRVTDPAEHVFVDYKGASLPQEFVDILNQAELDREAACKEYGVALTVGDVKISYPEFLAYYYDQHSAKKQEVQRAIEQKGFNMTGYDTSKMPDDQPCLNRGYTWAEEFTRDAIASIQENYEGFDKAIEAKIKFTDTEVNQLISEYNRLELYSQVQNKTYEELFEGVYTKGFTEAMFKAREIMLAYKQKYWQHAKQELADSYSESLLKKTLESNMSDYTVVLGRVYPIEGEFDAVEVSKVSNEKEFLEYADNNHPNENYDPDIRTYCDYQNKEVLASTFGPEVGEWMFSEERVAGEIAVIEGQLFKYLVYVEKPAYLSVSRKIMFCGYDYFEGITDTEKENYLEEMTTFYEDWKAGGENKAEFEEFCLTFNEQAVYDARLGDFHYSFNNWIFDEARKPGDHILLETEVGCCVFYFIDENKDDYDWKVNMRTKMSEIDYRENYKAEIAENYEVKRKENIITKAQKEVNVTITRQLKEEENK